MSQKINGLIALDIDGTITADMHSIPGNVIAYLTSLNEKGWDFFFVTGRTFEFGYTLLQELPFNYFYAVQNGAILLEMPQQKILSKIYLSKTLISSLEGIGREESTDFVIYSGKEHDNICFFRPERLTSTLRTYLEARRQAYSEQWIPLRDFDDTLPVEEFPSIKFFGKLDAANRISKKLEERLDLHAPVIKDPFDSDYYIIQATHPHVSKGQSLSHLQRLRGFKGKTIAAGDDLNDLSMLLRADVSIAMDNAPDSLKKAATIIAPTAQEEGIIKGLGIATEMLINGGM